MSLKPLPPERPSMPPGTPVPPTTPHHEVVLIGESEPIRALDAQVDQAARSDAKVLITGETGSGKEVVARLIHHRSKRHSQPIVTLNCAGVPESLLESELFGHARGAFTGAIRDKRGLLELAAGGTVFLDEIGEMSLRMQAVLLRFLQNGEIQRVGADRSHARANVRLICATNRDLAQQVADGLFREDFFFRLNVVNIVVPPLRARLSDLPSLVAYLLATAAAPDQPRVSLAPEALDALGHYSWPGNVRELRNVLERLVVNARGPVVTMNDLPAHIRAGSASSAGPTARPANGALVNELAARMLVHGESFWSVVAAPFAAGTLSHDDLKKIVRLGLERTEGRHRNLLALFNMPPEDQARFLSFLREHDCHLPAHALRADSRSDKRRGPAANDY